MSNNSIATKYIKFCEQKNLEPTEKDAAQKFLNSEEGQSLFEKGVTVSELVKDANGVYSATSEDLEVANEFATILNMIENTELSDTNGDGTYSLDEIMASFVSSNDEDTDSVDSIDSSGGTDSTDSAGDSTNPTSGSGAPASAPVTSKTVADYSNDISAQKDSYKSLTSQTFGAGASSLESDKAAINSMKGLSDDQKNSLISAAEAKGSAHDNAQSQVDTLKGVDEALGEAAQDYLDSTTEVSAAQEKLNDAQANQALYEQEATDLTAQQTNINTQLTTLNTQQEANNTALTAANEKVTSCQSALESAQSALDNAAEDADKTSLEAAVNEAKEALAAAEAEQKIAQQKVDDTQTQIDEQNTLLKDVETQIAANTASLEAAKAEVSTCEEALNTAKTKLDADKNKYDAMKVGHEADVTAFETAMNEYNTAADAYNTQKQTIENEVLSNVHDNRDNINKVNEDSVNSFVNSLSSSYYGKSINNIGISSEELQLAQQNNVNLSEKLENGQPRYIITQGDSDGQYHIYDMQNGGKSIAREYGTSGGGYNDNGIDIVSWGNGTFVTVDSLNSMDTMDTQKDCLYVNEDETLSQDTLAGRTYSPLSFDINGDGIKTSSDIIDYDIDGDGEVDRIYNSADAVLVFDNDNDGIVGEDGSECFGNNTDIDGDGKADGYANGFEALRAMARKLGLINDKDDNILDEDDLKLLESEYGLKIKTSGYNSEAQSLSEVGITEIRLSTDNETTLEENFDSQGDDLMEQADALFEVNGELREYADIWHRKVS